MVIIVCGVSGAGKSTIGEALAQRLGWPFLDADDFHPAANIEKMRRGEALSDDDRWPWLDRLAQLIAEQDHAVLACSALKQAHRERLGVDQEQVRTVFLEGDKELIASRISNRSHEFMPAALLESQFDALEPPVDGVRVSIAGSPESICEEILRTIGKSAADR